MMTLPLAAAAAALQCTVTATAAMPSLQGHREVVLEVALDEPTARSIGSGAAPLMPMRFAGEREPARGWIVRTGEAVDRPLLMIARVTPRSDAAEPFFVRYGFATPAPEAEAWDWQEAMRGPCRLATQEDSR